MKLNDKLRLVVVCLLATSAVAAYKVQTVPDMVKATNNLLVTLTPEQTEGPFYPDKLPLDTDNDLIIINEALTSAVGEVTHLGGRVLDSSGEPLRNVTVEIWQVDGNGVYLHSRSAGRAARSRCSSKRLAAG